jgi:Transposase domain (DUF772)
MMLKIMVLQALYSLSDEQAEFQIQDRLSFMRFLGLGLGDKVPDLKTIWLFREHLTQARAVENLFARFDKHLSKAGYLAMGGQIADATIVAAPRQRNSDAEKANIKEGKVPDEWQKKPAKLRQKDRDVCWTVKFSKAKVDEEGKTKQRDIAVPAFGYHLADRRDQAGMVVGHDQLDALEAARLQADEEVLPGRAALAIGHLHRQDLAPPIPVDADCDQHRLAHDDAGFAHLLVAGVEDEVGERRLKRAFGKGLQALVQTLVDGRDRRGGEGMTTELFRDRLDLPGRHTLHVHLRKRRHQGPLGTLVALEQFRREAAGPVLRNPQLKLADTGDKGAAVITRAITEALRRAFALRSAQRLLHLGLEHLLHHGADHFVQPVRVRQQNVFDGGAGGLTFSLGHGGVPSRESVT